MADTTKLTVDYSQVLQGLDAVDNALSDTAKKYTQLSEAAKKAGKEQSAAFNIDFAKGLSQGLKDVQKEYDDMVESAKTLKAALKGATDPTAIKLYAGSIAQLELGMKKMEQTAKGAGLNLKETNKNANTGKEVFENFFGAFGKVALITGAIQAVISFAKYAVNLASETKKATLQFTAFTGSAEKAAGVVADLTGFAAKKLINTEDVFAAGKSLLAFGENADNLAPVLSRIADISAATGKDFGELTTIYGKARTAGVLYAGDINQLIDAGVPIIQEFAKQLGVSNDQVKKLASEGKISFEELQLAFFNLTAEGGKFAGQASINAQSIGGAWEGLVSKIKPAITTVGQELESLVTKGINGFSNLIDWAKDLGAAVGNGFEFTDDAKVRRNPFLADRAEIEKDRAQYEKDLSDRDKLEKAAADKRKELAKKAGSDAAKARSDAEKARIDAMKDGEAKEIALEQRRFAELAKQLKKYHLDTTEAEEQHGLNVSKIRVKYFLERQKLDEDGRAAERNALLGLAEIATEQRRFDLQLASLRAHNSSTEQAEKDHAANVAKIKEQYFSDVAAIEQAGYKSQQDDLTNALSELEGIEKEDKARKKANADANKEVQKQAADLATANFEGSLLAARAVFFEQKRTDAEIRDYEKGIAELREAFQLEMQKKELQRELDFGQDLSSAEKATLEQRIKNISEEIDQLAQGFGKEQGKKKPFSLFSLLGIDVSTDEGKKAAEQVKTATEQILSSLSQVTDARLEAAQAKVDIADKEVQAAQDALDTELELQQQGYASNVAARQADLDDAKRARDTAVAEQQKAARAQLAIDSIQQASALVSSSINLIKTWSTLPFGVGLIAAAGQIAGIFALVASIRNKSKAISAQQFREGGAGWLSQDGYVSGKTHEQGGHLLEVEHGELLRVGDDAGRRRVSIVRRERVADYHDLLDAANNNDKPAMLRHAATLAGAGQYSGLLDAAANKDKSAIIREALKIAGAITLVQTAEHGAYAPVIEFRHDRETPGSVRFSPAVNTEKVRELVFDRTATIATAAQDDTQQKRTNMLLELMLREMTKKQDTWSADGRTRTRGNVTTKYTN